MAIIDILTPALGESVSEATIAKIYKKTGDSVKKNELIAEIETEKVMLEICALSDGTISSIKSKNGDIVHTGDIIGKIDTSASIAKTEVNSVENVNIEKSENIPPKDPSPAAKKYINEGNIDLNKIIGSGKDGQILKHDVLNIAIIESKNNTCDTNSDCNAKRTETVKMSKLRQTIAKRLKDSQNNAAILTTFNEIDMTNVMKLRNDYKDKFEKKYGIKLGFMSFFVKAVVNALQEIPSINAEINGTDIIYKNYYDIGVAVGTEQGLVVPVVRKCDTLSLAAIETQIANYGKKAKDGKLEISDMQGGTFTISNGGVYGSLLSTPIINPPQSGILGLHNIVQRPVAINGLVEVRSMMYIALSYDHRLVDGKEAVTFLVKIKDIIENPVRLIIGI